MAQRFSEAAFIASSTGNFKFQNVEKRDTEKSYVSEWVNSLYGVNKNEKSQSGDWLFSRSLVMKMF